MEVLVLRLMEGVSKADFEMKFHVSIQSIYKEVIERSIKDLLLQEKEGRLYLTDRGIDLSNTVMARFLID